MKSVIIYQSHFDLIQNLTDEEAGMLIKVIGEYSKQNPNNPNGLEITNPLIRGIFMVMKRDFDIQSENYEKKCEVNKKNGSLGGRPKTKQNPNGFSETQPNPQNLKDKDKDKDKDKENTSTSASANSSIEDFDFTNKPKGELNKLLDEILSTPFTSI